ncbi:MAG: hypothetical protein KY442_00585, partial [Proteobacteria bacterium]|nr:hypothetical protein [Pseudomonadota bacterium]
MSPLTRSHATADTRTHRVVSRRGRAWPSVAAERLGGYETGGRGATHAAAAPGNTRADAAPFGFTVLADSPALAS